MPFSSQLRTARDLTGMTQVKAAEYVGVSRFTLEKWEEAKRTPKPMVAELVLRKLARHPQARQARKRQQQA